MAQACTLRCPASLMQKQARKAKGDSCHQKLRTTKQAEGTGNTCEVAARSTSTNNQLWEIPPQQTTLRPTLSMQTETCENEIQLAWSRSTKRQTHVADFDSLQGTHSQSLEFRGTDSGCPKMSW